MDARSGATLSLVGNEVFLFGGTVSVFMIYVWSNCAAFLGTEEV